MQDLPGIRFVDQDGIGLAAARNQGLAETEEPLVAWLDADDRWPAASLCERLAALEDNAELVVGQVAFGQIGPVPDDRYREHSEMVAVGYSDASNSPIIYRVRPRSRSSPMSARRSRWAGEYTASRPRLPGRGSNRSPW